MALMEALMGNEREAQERATIALEHSTGRDVQYGAALALALTKDSTRVRSLADDLARRFPEDTHVQFSYLPTLRAQLALNRKDATEAIETLQVALPLSFYPVYVRGYAYLAARRGTEAAAEFKKIVEHPGVVANEPIGALAHLGLGRAYAIQGEMAKSRAAYADFFARWKNADRGIPRLAEAKADYSNLP
jgi:predicted Zn-dependent protease